MLVTGTTAYHSPWETQVNGGSIYISLMVQTRNEGVEKSYWHIPAFA